MGNRIRSFPWTVLVLATVFAGVAHARTWNVEKDGSGDFTVIQDAVDVAEDGDIIMIGPGRYTEYTEYSWGNVYVYLSGDRSLTFVGAGVEQTIIGPDVYPSGYRDYGVRSDNGLGVYRFENLRIENQNFRGLAMLNYAVELVGC
nr:hypothetical protein [Candidatus Krumholzibacteria bacterium]